MALNEAAERLTAVAELARCYPDARIVFSGGSGALIYDEAAEAPFARRLLEGLGVARARITLEDRSRNTVENAVLSKAIAQPPKSESMPIDSPILGPTRIPLIQLGRNML